MDYLLPYIENESLELQFILCFIYYSHMCLFLYSSFPEWFRGRVAAHVVLLEGFGVEAFATGDHGTGHAGFAHFVHSGLAFHRHPHGTRYAAGRRTCVLGVGAAAVEVALVLRCRTGVLSH